MYHAQTSMEPPLPPQAYCAEEVWERERRAVFASAWHLVGTASSLQRPGQYLTLELLGVPLLVRNFDGELSALRNVCAHRQAILTTKSSGCSESLSCPYHGWEYGVDGRTRRLPGATNFPKFDHGRYCLERFAVAQCGDLVFVRLSKQGPTLREFLGDRYDLFSKWFSPPEYRQAMFRRLDYAANWKIPVEASLESYHIPWVHPKTFNEDPGEMRSTHLFHDSGTSFETVFLAPRWIDRRLRDAERLVLSILGIRYTGDYQHHHVFPNILVSHTDSLSLIQVVHPAGPARSFALAWQFGIEPARRGPFLKTLARGWAQFTSWLTRTILAEDMHIYPLVQAGVAGASGPGLLGRCEERLYASQKYVRDRIDALAPPEHALGECRCHTVADVIPAKRDVVEEQGTHDA